MTAFELWAPVAIRPRNESIRDLTTSLETEVPADSDPPVRALRVNNAFAHARRPDPSPSLDYRFDVQVNQALPFMPFPARALGSARGPPQALPRSQRSGSIYDELLVVRPPKRVVGGVLIRF